MNLFLVENLHSVSKINCFYKISSATERNSFLPFSSALITLPEEEYFNRTGVFSDKCNKITDSDTSKSKKKR